LNFYPRDGTIAVRVRKRQAMAEKTRQLWEQVLVIRFQSGDVSAFTEIVEAIHPRLRSFALSLCDGRTDEVEDVLQDVWFDAYRTLRRLRRPGALRSWLYRITRNKLAKAFHWRRLQPASLDSSHEPAADEAEPTFGQDDLDHLRKAMGLLSREHREVVALRFVEGMSYEEIGQVTDSNVGTVRSRLYYAKKRLREDIERMNHERR
jgi:RNA polymerase sigma-70 factor (ECF subfamily)